MSHQSKEAPTNVAIIGLGLQGTVIARLLLDAGYAVSGVVDPGPKRGRPIADFVDHPSAPGLSSRARCPSCLQPAQHPTLP